MKVSAKSPTAVAIAFSAGGMPAVRRGSERRGSHQYSAFGYDEQNFLYNMRFAGPYAGLGFRW